MPCYRCGVRQTDPSRGQSPWKRGVRQYSQILICPGCQDAADWVADLDRCSQCSSVHLVKRLGEVECRDCGAIVPPEAAAEAGYPEVSDEGRAGARPVDAGRAGGAVTGGAVTGEGLAGQGLAGHGEADLEGSGPAAAGRGADLSEEVARALDRVLGRSLVSQSLQRAPDPEGGAGSGAGRHRPARTAAGHHAAAHRGGPGASVAPGEERQRAARPGAGGAGAACLDEVRPGAFTG